MSAIAAHLRVLDANVDRLFPHGYAGQPERRAILHAYLAQAIAAEERQRLVYRRVDPDNYEIGPEGSTTRYRLARPGFHAVHAAIALRAPVPVSEFAGPGKSAPSTRLRNMIDRAGVWTRSRYPALAFAFTFGAEGAMRIADGVLVFDPPSNAPVILA